MTEEDIEFEKLFADKRHKEMVSLLSKVISALKEEKDTGVVRAIQSGNKKIDTLITELKNIDLNVEAPNVTIDQDQIVASLTRLKEDISNRLTELHRPTEWEFEVIRNYGVISKIIAKSK